MKILICLCTLSLFGLAFASSWRDTEQELNKILEQIAVWKNEMQYVLDHYYNVYGQDVLKKNIDLRLSNIMEYKNQLEKKPACDKTFADALNEHDRLNDDLKVCADNAIKVTENLIKEFHPTIESYENKIIDLQKMKCGDLKTTSAAFICNILVHGHLLVYKTLKLADNLLPLFLSTRSIPKKLKKLGNCFDIFDKMSDRNENQLKLCFKY